MYIAEESTGLPSASTTTCILVLNPPPVTSRQPGSPDHFYCPERRYPVQLAGHHRQKPV